MGKKKADAEFSAPAYLTPKNQIFKQKCLVYFNNELCQICKSAIKISNNVDFNNSAKE